MRFFELHAHLHGIIHFFWIPHAIWRLQAEYRATQIKISEIFDYGFCENSQKMLIKFFDEKGVSSFKTLKN